jgi:ABC-type nickel/cobalt efflux system permease component RcnA
MNGSTLTPPERALRWACLLVLLLAAVATVAAWDVAAIILFAIGIPATVVSLVMEWLTARHRNRLLRPFYPEADDFLERLFHDQEE